MSLVDVNLKLPSYELYSPAPHVLNYDDVIWQCPLQCCQTCVEKET